MRSNINSVFHFDRGFDRYVDSDVLWDRMTPEDGKTSSKEHALHTSRQVLDGVLAWVDENGAPPYSVQVNVMEVHQAFIPPVRKPANSSPLAREPAAPYLLALQEVSAEIGRFVELLLQRRDARTSS
jgi:hypothetical protein